MVFVRRLLFVVILLASLAPVAYAQAQQQQLALATITDVDVTTVDGKPLAAESLMAGATYKVSFAIQVAAGLKEKLSLSTSLIRASGTDRFWTLKGDYAGINATSWQPGQSSISFDGVEGKALLQLEGTVPPDYLSGNTSTGETLHAGKEISMLQLSLESGTVVSDLKYEVVDRAIEEYRTVLTAKKQLLANTSADPSYTSLVKAIIASAEAQAAAGLTDNALDTLKTIPDSGWVGPRSSTSYQWIIIGVLAVLLLVFGFLLTRARAEASSLMRQTDDQAKRLQLLALKASRIGDPALTEGIEQVRKELQRTSGGI